MEYCIAKYNLWTCLYTSKVHVSKLPLGVFVGIVTSFMFLSFIVFSLVDASFVIGFSHWLSLSVWFQFSLLILLIDCTFRPFYFSDWLYFSPFWFSWLIALLFLLIFLIDCTSRPFYSSICLLISLYWFFCMVASPHHSWLV